MTSETTVLDIFTKGCQENNIDLIRHLLPVGVDVNWRSEHYSGNSGLHYAAEKNYGELLELLLGQTGVDVNIRNNLNMTPLMLACYQGHENIVRRLCQVAGIQLNCRDDYGQTALQWAVSQNKPACVSMISALLTAEVEISLRLLWRGIEETEDSNKVK